MENWAWPDNVATAHGGFALSILCTGEFGVVYRAKLLRKQGKCDPGFVAVKTMRGMLQLGSNQWCCFYFQRQNAVKNISENQVYCEWLEIALCRVVHDMMILTDIEGMRMWRYRYSTGTILSSYY